MKIDFSQNIIALDGKPFEKEVGVLATLGDMCVSALLTELRDVPTKPEDKLNRWELAKRIYKQGEVELKIEDIALIKKSVGSVYMPALMGAIYDLLETN